MQYRMKTHQLSQDEIHALLIKSLTGTISTIGPDGVPYSVPVHFVFLDGTICFHGLPAGQKLDNLKAKYTPQLVGRELPSNMVKGTAVVRISIDTMTGKYYQ